MHTRLIATLKKAALLLPILLVCGCGGSSGPQPPGDIWIDDPPNTLELLRAEGLIVSLETDKVVYQKGEQITVWLAVRNEGSRVRTLSAHPMAVPSSYDSAEANGARSGETLLSNGIETYKGGFLYYTPDGHDYLGAWGFVSYDLVQRDVPPGETIRLMEFVWDQVNSDGTPAAAGYYDATIRVSNLYVDGRMLADVPSFIVDGFKVIRIDE